MGSYGESYGGHYESIYHEQPRADGGCRGRLQPTTASGSGAYSPTATAAAVATSTGLLSTFFMLHESDASVGIRRTILPATRPTTTPKSNDSKLNAGVWVYY